MTADQQELRLERIAIMVESGSTTQSAEAYCDRHPELYGIRDITAKQEGLF